MKKQLIVQVLMKTILFYIFLIFFIQEESMGTSLALKGAGALATSKAKGDKTHDAHPPSDNKEHSQEGSGKPLVPLTLAIDIHTKLMEAVCQDLYNTISGAKRKTILLADIITPISEQLQNLMKASNSSHSGKTKDESKGSKGASKSLSKVSLDVANQINIDILTAIIKYTSDIVAGKTKINKTGIKSIKNALFGLTPFKKQKGSYGEKMKSYSKYLKDHPSYDNKSTEATRNFHIYILQVVRDSMIAINADQVDSPSKEKKSKGKEKKSKGNQSVDSNDTLSSLAKSIQDQIKGLMDKLEPKKDSTQKDSNQKSASPKSNKKSR